MKRKSFEFKGINSFDMKIHYVEIDSLSSLNENESHTHNECEIYINLSGDVSFEVENAIYPVVPGSIVITRPAEKHHCVYHSNDLHKHFWILFSPNGNERLLDMFFDREKGTGNLLHLSANDTAKLIDVCRKLLDCDGEIEKYYLFFKLIGLLQGSQKENAQYEKNDCVSIALNYIDNNISRAISVREVAEASFISVNTLERKFKERLGVSPSAYIKKKRLAVAAGFLQSGCGVTETAERSGFADCSNFIVVFKKEYGITPYKYKQRLSR